MQIAGQVPQATVYRLSLYHCYLGELLRVDASDCITSRQLAEQSSTMRSPSSWG